MIIYIILLFIIIYNFNHLLIIFKIVYYAHNFENYSYKQLIKECLFVNIIRKKYFINFNKIN
jgi:hypothetical protein